ncbi:MAG: hypothetical protein EOM06_10110 [Sphingobacteriia bacterium]|nr:hypothetical protein [Sphingobacteriia bacterium]
MDAFISGLLCFVCSYLPKHRLNGGQNCLPTAMTNSTVRNVDHSVVNVNYPTKLKRKCLRFAHYLILQITGIL